MTDQIATKPTRSTCYNFSLQELSWSAAEVFALELAVQKDFQLTFLPSYGQLVVWLQKAAAKKPALVRRDGLFQS